HSTALDQPSDLGLNPPGELHFGTGDGNAVERRAPALDVVPLVRPCELPGFDQAGWRIGKGLVQRIGVFGMDAFVDVFLAEHVIDGLQDRRPRAKREGERQTIECQTSVGEFSLPLATALVELARNGALKGEDRLLFVADGEDGALYSVAC